MALLGNFSSSICKSFGLYNSEPSTTDYNRYTESNPITSNHVYANAACNVNIPPVSSMMGKGTIGSVVAILLGAMAQMTHLMGLDRSLSSLEKTRKSEEIACETAKQLVEDAYEIGCERIEMAVENFMLSTLAAALSFVPVVGQAASAVMQGFAGINNAMNQAKVDVMVAEKDGKKMMGDARRDTMSSLAGNDSSSSQRLFSSEKVFLDLLQYVCGQSKV